jgi:hypothetical protein
VLPSILVMLIMQHTSLTDVLYYVVLQVKAIDQAGCE